MNDPGDWLLMADGMEHTPSVTWREEDGVEVARWFLENGRTLERRRAPDFTTSWWLTDGGLDDPPRMVSMTPPARILPDDLPEVS